MKRHNTLKWALVSAPPLLLMVASCGSIPVDPLPLGVESPPTGVIEGSVLYSGPHPCSASGHIIGNAVIFVFNYDNQPPPNGIAAAPSNFTVVTGDTLFPNEPVEQSSTKYCPMDHGITETITASASYQIVPIPAGQYIMQSFFDYNGDFLPSFKFRDLPELGDIGGGHIDLTPNDAGVTVFPPVTIGVATEVGDASTFVIPDEGYVAEGVSVVLGQTLVFTRPYFYPQAVDYWVDDAGNLGSTPASSAADPWSGGDSGSTETDPNYVPILTFPADLQTAPSPDPTNVINALAEIPYFEASLPHVSLNWGVPAEELGMATDAGEPFHFQVAAYDTQDPTSTASINVWTTGTTVAGNPSLDSYWPSLALTKLVEDPTHTIDPESVISQGGLGDPNPGDPIVLIQAITLAEDDTGFDSLQNTSNILSTQPLRYQDHVMGAILPVALCFDSNDLSTGGTLVTPYNGDDAGPGQLLDPTCFGTNPTCSLVTELAAQGINITEVVTGCLPTGRYALNAFYPDSQAWTTPNETGSCATQEGVTDYSTLSCPLQPRPILYSQGDRGVVEVTAGAACGKGVPNTPAKCIPCASRPGGVCTTND